MLKGPVKYLAKFHHIGIAVKDFYDSVNFYNGLGYKHSKPVIDNLQKVELVMLSSDFFPPIELIKPTSGKSPVNNYLKKTAK